MMKRFVVSAIVLLACMMPLVAQNTDKMISRISAAAAEMNSMKCDFVQVRRMSMLAEEIESSGVMYFEKPSKLRWEYLAPSLYCLTIDGDKVMIESETGKTVTDASTSRLYKGIADMIMGCMSGDALRNSRTFRVTMTNMGSVWTAELKPVRKDVGRMFESLILNFDPQTGLLRSMIMNDASGNSTSITISNISVNGDYGVKW